jgi:hypothetical protein
VIDWTGERRERRGREGEEERERRKVKEGKERREGFRKWTPTNTDTNTTEQKKTNQLFSIDLF